MASSAEAAAFQSERDFFLGATIAMLASCTLAIALRVATKALVVKRWRWDDTFLAVSFVLFLGVCGISFSLLFNQPQGSAQQSYLFNTRMIRAHNVTFCFALMFVKISLGIFFLGIFNAATHKWERYVVYATLVIPTVVSLVHIGFSSFSCYAAVSAVWGEQCNLTMDYTRIAIAWATTDSLSDITLAAISIHTLARVQGLSTYARLSASILLLLGTSGGAISIMRLYIQIAAASTPLDGVSLARYYNLEIGLCITATSLAAVRPLVQRAGTAMQLSRPKSAISTTASTNASSWMSRVSRKASLAPTLMTERSYVSGRKMSGDTFFDYVSRNKSEAIARACSDMEAGTLHVPSFLIADPGGLLSDVRNGSMGEKACDIIITREVDIEVSKPAATLGVPVGKGRTKSVCFGMVTPEGEVLDFLTRPAMIRAKSSKC